MAQETPNIHGNVNLVEELGGGGVYWSETGGGGVEYEFKEIM